MKEIFKRLFQNDFFVAFLLLLAYLCTHHYVYAWDDQHLEIPLLKHLIDPTLYRGDYYVESLTRNFSSFLYPILAKIIKVDWIPATYLVLFLLSRYFMFYWIYRLWCFISGDRLSGVIAVLAFLVMGRTEEFLYRTFSHQEFSYIFMFAGLYYFYRERYILSAFLLGVGANFHAVYALFPMAYMLVYLFLFRKDRFTKCFKAGLTFLLAAMPFLMWQIPKTIKSMTGPQIPVSEWMPLYLMSCPQNFLFSSKPLAEALQDPTFVLIRTEPYLFLFVLYLLLCLLDRNFRADRKVHVIVFIAYSLIILSCVFTYVYPKRFIFLPNLLRNEQVIRFMLMGYFVVYACRKVQKAPVWQVILIGILFFFVGFSGIGAFEQKLRKYQYVLPVMSALFVLLCFKPNWLWLRRMFILVPLGTALVSYTIFHYKYAEVLKTGGGIWEMHRNWVDMQKYVKAHTDKDALIMTPYDTDTGGFRIFSERKVLVCYRDSGIVALDDSANKEWSRRIEDIKGFKMMSKGDIALSVINGIMKYKVDYIVFMNYYQPQDDNVMFKKMYQNNIFSLYKVNR